MRTPRRAAVWAGLLLIFPLLPGCLFTKPMWEDANTTRLTDPSVYAVLQDNEKGGAARTQLILAYHLGSYVPRHHGAFLVMPLGEDGCPPYPFVYSGEARTGEQILEAVGDDQRRAIAAAVRHCRDGPWGMRIMNSPAYRRFGWQQDGIWKAYRSDDESGLRAKAIRLGRPAAEHEHGDDPLRDPYFPHDACIIVYPSSIPRPQHERRAAQVKAALLTPLTLVGDAVCIPVLLVGCYVFGACP